MPYADRNCSALNNLCLFAIFPCGSARRFHYYLCTSNTPCFRGADPDGVPPSPETAEEFSGWRQRDWPGERVAPIGFTPNPLEKGRFTAQIAAAQPKKSNVGQSGSWLVSSSQKKNMIAFAAEVVFICSSAN